MSDCDEVADSGDTEVEAGGKIELPTLYIERGKSISIQAVLKPQAGDLGEVHGIAGEERCVVEKGSQKGQEAGTPAETVWDRMSQPL